MFYYFTDRGNLFNEDFVYGTGDFGVLLDGATGLNNKKFTTGNTDAQYWSHLLGTKLIEKIEADDEQSLEQNISEALTSASEAYFHNIGTDIAVEESDLPSCTLSCFKIRNHIAEFAIVGDSPLIIKKGEQEHIFIDEKLEANEQLAINEIKSYLKEGLSFQEGRQKINPLLQKFRNERNTEEGYPILDPTMKGLSEIGYHTFPVEEIDAIILCSDGFYRLLDVFEVLTDQTFIESLQSYPKAVAWVDKLRQLEKQQDSLRNFVRLKESDDASVNFWKQ
ncbi:PP2C family serine/threonine-protein phosphatase [Vagococcus elongatus]|uniref:PPM-type phosphatase domain-containing protein n=1 Tax=Vagococcus elongatus TaxID=180344 RepID=A0A430B5R1_9ENTE|nr:PP2C family serine/threonine-protein phosphatase [Vagococcus elongatus]RSU15641.1 hypothetical protein CBF29_00780 [Vagococcus elongatus]